MYTALPVTTGVSARLRQQRLFIYTLPSNAAKSLPLSRSPWNKFCRVVLLTSYLIILNIARILYWSSLKNRWPVAY